MDFKEYYTHSNGIDGGANPTTSEFTYIYNASVVVS
jgi:hypothetical protein